MGKASEAGPDQEPRNGLSHAQVMDRRTLLSLSGLVGLGVGLGIGIPYGRSGDTATRARPEPEVNPNIDTVNNAVAKGLQTWKDLILFPGFIVARPGSRFFSDASLTQPTELISGEQCLGIQRPFFASASLNQNPDSLGGAFDAVMRDDPLSAGTLAFLPPNNKDSAYVYATFNPDLMDVYDRGYDLGNNVPPVLGLTGQQLQFVGNQGGRHAYGSQQIPYVEHNYAYDNRRYRRIGTEKFFHAVAMSGVYAGSFDANNVGRAFEQDTTFSYDPLVIPGFQHQIIRSDHHTQST